MSDSQNENPQVTVSARTLAIIERAIGERLRRHYRISGDQEVYDELNKIHQVALRWELTHEHVSGIVLATADGALSEVMTTDEAAAAAGVDRATICWHLRRGHLSGERRGRRWFVTTDALAAYMIRRAA